MTMQHRFTMTHNGMDVDVTRAMPKLEKSVHSTETAAANRRAAAVHAEDDSPWYAIRVASGRELAVENSMRISGVECLVPMRKGRELRRRGRVMLPVIPVMVGYALVRFELSTGALLGVCGMDNVIDLVGGMLTPRGISHCEVREFDNRARNGHFDWSQRFTGLKRDVRVQVIHGPFKGACGRIVSARADGLGDAVIRFNDSDKIPPALLPLAILQKL